MVPWWHTALYYLSAISGQFAQMVSLPMTSPELGYHFQIIANIFSLSDKEWSIIWLHLADRKTLCLQAFTWKQRQMAIYKLKAIPQHLPSRRQRAKGWLTSCPELPGWAVSRGPGLHFKSRAFFSCLLPGSRGESNNVIEGDNEELLHTFYLLVSFCQEFRQKTLPSLYMTPLFTLLFLMT